MCVCVCVCLWTLVWLCSVEMVVSKRNGGYILYTPTSSPRRFFAIQTMIHFVSNGPAQPMDCPLLNETLLPVLIVTRMITAKILLAATPGD